MGRETYFVVLPHKTSRKNRPVPGEPIPAQSAAHARRLAERLRERHDGVVAFSRTGDPVLGEWDEAVILAAWGNLPVEVLLAAAQEEEPEAVPA